ncbi:MAG: acetyl-CoA decarbonylase/synthase complex subunit gamma [Candidatus Aminicenantales bacterium]
MALSGLDIFKLLPKTNCGDCGVPTCMAFAMKLAQKKAELSECPHASEEAKERLGAASEPPIRLVRIGGTPALEVGNETVMFRHEKTFFHQTGIALQLRSSLNPEKILSLIREIEDHTVVRAGETLKIELFFLTHDSRKKDDFIQAVDCVRQNSSKGVILDCADEDTLEEGLNRLRNDHPSIFLRREIRERDMDLARACDASLILASSTFEDLAAQADKARSAGFFNLLLNLEASGLGKRLQNNTILRRSALKKRFKPFGYPLLAFLQSEERENEACLLADAALLISKYASVVVLPVYDRALLYSLLTLRQNIYTDPQKPIQVDAKVYPIGEPTPDSAVFVTTNFSLTYFMVSGEIENSGISAHLVVADTEGQSVLTAWAAGKFGGEKIAKFIKDIQLEEHVRTRKIVIPGFVSQISGELEENLPGWEVIVGPQEASDIASFVKNVHIT